MEEENGRVSFRIDKKTNSLNQVKRNKFGHTVTKDETETPENVGVQLRMGGTSGVDAHVDIFESPMLKKFMLENNLNLQDSLEENSTTEIIDLSEEITNNKEQNYTRPESLEDFDKIADEVLGITTNKTKKTFAQHQPSDYKTCTSCSCKVKNNANFCPNCGKPQSKATFCKNCGHKFDLNENFCSECGTKRE